MNPSDQVIKEILEKYKRISVVGLSPKPERPSHGVTSYMIGAGYDITGVNPGVSGKILNRPVFSKLADVPGPIEIVDVFRASENIPGVVEEVLKTDAKVLWLQLGITHPPAEERARQAGLVVISNRCILVEHRRLL